MRISLAQMEVIPGQVQKNLQTALKLLQQAKEQNSQLVLFPELCLSGYLIGDLWEEPAFVAECQWAGQELVAQSQDIAVIFGNVGLCPTAQVGENGRARLYNAAWLAQNGQIISCEATGLPFFAKSLLPNYREFEECRYFYDLRRLALERSCSWDSLVAPVPLQIENQRIRVGISLCEDGWDHDYAQSPLTVLAEKGVDLLVNLSSSPYTRAKAQKRDRVFGAHAKSAGVPLAYVNCVGSQNNGKTFFGFDGDSVLYLGNGQVNAEAPRWQETLLNVDLTEQANASHDTPHKQDASQLDPQDFQCLIQVIRRYLQQSHIQRVVIGVSGGIDSAVSAALFTHLCGSENILLVSMPSRFNSKTTKNLSRQLSEQLGCWFVEVPIEPSVELTKAQIDGLTANRSQQSLELRLSAFHLENVQARDRSSRILAALASAFGGVFTCNANKAETMVGYSTLYGDHGGFLAPLGDLWKHEVHALGHYLNHEIFKHPVIPQGIFDIKPTAELSDAQNPEQGGGDPLVYWYHDRLFASWMQNWNRKGPEETLQSYLNGTLDIDLGLPQPISTLFSNAQDFIADLERWWSLFKGMGVVKRVQSPPIVALSRRAFGFDYRESIMNPWYSKKYLELKASLDKSPKN